MKKTVKRTLSLLLTLCLVFTLLPVSALAASPTITYFNCDVTIQTTKGKTVNLYKNITDSQRTDYFDQGQTAYSTKGAKVSDGSTWYQIQAYDRNGKIITVWLNAGSSGIKIINNVEVTEYFNCDVKIQTTKGTTVDLFNKPTDSNRKTYFDQGQTAYSTRGAKLSDGTTWYEFQANYNGNVVTLWLNAASNGVKIIDNKAELSISFSSNSLSLSPGSSETVRINFSGDGIYNLNRVLDDTSVCSTSWGDVDYTTGVTSLTVTGKSGGSTKITIQLRDRNGNTLHSKSFNVTVTPQTYTVSYNANGGSGAPSSQTKKYNEALSLSTTEPVRPGYTFKGWSTSANSSSISYQPGNTYYNDKSMTLYAVWEKNPTESSITFSTNPVTLNPGESKTISASFKGEGIASIYFDEGNQSICTAKWSGSTDWNKGTTAITLTAHAPGETTVSLGFKDAAGNEFFYRNINVTVTTSYTVSYNANGGSGAPSSQTKTQGKSLTLSSQEPARSGYTFKGWATSSGSSSIAYQPGSSYYDDKSVTLYAVWEKNPTESSIIFSTNSVTLNPGESKTISASFKGNGIAGIYFDEGNQSICTAKWSGNTDWNMGTTAITLTAHAQGETTVSLGLKDEAGNEFFSRSINVTVTAPTYTVSYNANGGSGAPSSQTKTHDKSLTLSSQQPTRSGYTFKGWSASSGSSSIAYQPGNTYTGNKNLTLYAVWEKNPTQSSITFSTNSVTLKPGESKTVSASFKGGDIAGIYFDEGNRSICTAKWSGNTDWNKGTTAITLTAHSSGETTVSLGLKDEAGNELFSRSINVIVTASAASTLKINATDYPKGTLTVGSYYSLRGTVTSNYKITSIKAEILTSSGKSTGNTKTVSPNANSYSFFGSAIDTAMKFNTLSAGTYYLKYTAKDSSGKTASWQSPQFKIKKITVPASSSATVEKAISQMEAWAIDNSHGYTQNRDKKNGIVKRWGAEGDYDCSSAVISAWELAGVPVKTAGATYTGDMLGVFKRNGFVDVTSSVNQYTGDGLQRGDVLLNIVNHTAMYCGNGKLVEASINEKGGIYNGKPGDQTGREFLIHNYYSFPWDCVLRYVGN